MLWSQNSSRNFKPLPKTLFKRKVTFHFKVIEGHLSKNHHVGWLIDFLEVLLCSWTPFILNLAIKIAILLFWAWSGVIYFSSFKKMTGAIFIKIKIVILLLLTLGAMAIIKKNSFLVLDYPQPLNLFLITFWLLNLITQSSLALPTRTDKGLS